MTITTQRAVEVPPWAGTDRPTTPAAWVRRAEEVAAILEVDAVERDRALATPYDEVRLLKQAGLVTLLGPASQGGAGQGWGTAYRVVRRVAAGDGSIGQLLGYHYLWSQLPAGALVPPPPELDVHSRNADDNVARRRLADAGPGARIAVSGTADAVSEMRTSMRRRAFLRQNSDMARNLAPHPTPCRRTSRGRMRTAASAARACRADLA